MRIPTIIDFDEDANVLYARIRDETVVHSEESPQGPSVVLNFNAAGRVVGLQLVDVALPHVTWLTRVLGSDMDQNLALDVFLWLCGRFSRSPELPAPWQGKRSAAG